MCEYRNTKISVKYALTYNKMWYKIFIKLNNIRKHFEITPTQNKYINITSWNKYLKCNMQYLYV